MHCNAQFTINIGPWREFDTQFMVTQDNVNGWNCVY